MKHGEFLARDLYDGLWWGEIQWADGQTGELELEIQHSWSPEITSYPDPGPDAVPDACVTWAHFGADIELEVDEQEVVVQTATVLMVSEFTSA